MRCSCHRSQVKREWPFHFPCREELKFHLLMRMELESKSLFILKKIFGTVIHVAVNVNGCFADPLAIRIYPVHSGLLQVRMSGFPGFMARPRDEGNRHIWRARYDLNLNHNLTNTSNSKYIFNNGLFKNLG